MLSLTNVRSVIQNCAGEFSYQVPLERYKCVMYLIILNTYTIISHPKPCSMLLLSMVKPYFVPYPLYTFSAYVNGRMYHPLPKIFLHNLHLVIHRNLSY